MTKWKMIGALLFFVPSLSSIAAEDQALETTAMTNGLPTLACRFETSERRFGEQAGNEARTWYLWREPDRMEMREADGKSGQIWRRDRSGQVSYQQIFHAAKRVIEYYPGDLRVLQNYPDWKRLASMIDPSILGSLLMAEGEIFILGRQARRYTGQVDGQEFDILWLEKEQIPVRVHRKNQGHEEISELKEIRLLNESPWPRNEVSGYEFIDYADLGDKETDPFVRFYFHGKRSGHDHAH